MKKQKRGRKTTGSKIKKKVKRLRLKPKIKRKKKKTRKYTNTKFKTKDASKSKRSRTKYRALDPNLNLRSRADLLEIDTKYLNDLKANPEAMDYLNKFNEEYVNASFNKHRKHIHKSKKLKRDSYNRNNARNRCIYTREKAQGKLDFIEDLKAGLENEAIEYENDLIDAIDDRKDTELFDKKTDNLKKNSNDSDDSSNSNS